jgi:hypothetical protein
LIPIPGLSGFLLLLIALIAVNLRNLWAGKVSGVDFARHALIIALKTQSVVRERAIYGIITPHD